MDTLLSYRSLYSKLEKSKPDIPSQHDSIIDMLKQVSELMIFGDKTNDRFFEYFCEKGFLALFNRVMRETREAKVQKQVLQSIMILMQNISNERSLFYLLSNNHINALLAAPFDAADEELLAYHVSLLKALSLQLNSATVHFFYNERARLIGFPLYTQAIKYMSHPDAMVQTAVRTTTLNVFRVPEPSVRTFVSSGARLQFFDRLAFCAGQHALNLNQRVAESVAAAKGWELRLHTASRRQGALRSGSTPGKGGSKSGVTPPLSPTLEVAGTCDHYTLRAFASPQGARAAVGAAMTAVADSWQALSDLLYYIGDIFSLGDATLSAAMSAALMRRFIRPLLLHSLTAAKCVVNERLQGSARKRNHAKAPPSSHFQTPPREGTGASKGGPSGDTSPGPTSPSHATARPPQGKTSLNPLSSYHGLQPLSLAAAADGVPPQVRVHPDPAPPWMSASQRAATLRRLPQVSGYPQGMAPPPPSRAVVLDTAVALHVTNAVLHAMPCSEVADPLCSWLLARPLVPHSAWTAAACAAAAAAVPPATPPVSAAARLPAHRPTASSDSMGGSSGGAGALKSVPEDLCADADERPLLITLPPLQPPLYLHWASCSEHAVRATSSNSTGGGIGQAAAEGANDGSVHTSSGSSPTAAAAEDGESMGTASSTGTRPSAHSRTLSLFGEESSTSLLAVATAAGPTSPRGSPLHRHSKSPPGEVGPLPTSGPTSVGSNSARVPGSPTSSSPQLRTGRDLLLVLSCLPDTRVSQAAISLLWTLAHGGGEPDLAQAPLSPPAGDSADHEEEAASLQGGLLDALKGGAWLTPDGSSGTPPLPGSPPAGRFFPSAWSSAADFGDSRFVSGEVLRAAGLEEARRSRAGLLLTSLTQDAGGGEGGAPQRPRGSTGSESIAASGAGAATRRLSAASGDVPVSPLPGGGGEGGQELEPVKGGSDNFDPLSQPLSMEGSPRSSIGQDGGGVQHSSGGGGSPLLHARHHSTNALSDVAAAVGDTNATCTADTLESAGQPDIGRSPRFQSDPGPSSAYESLHASTAVSEDSPSTGGGGALPPLASQLGEIEGGSVFSGGGGTSAWGGGLSGGRLRGHAEALLRITPFEARVPRVPPAEQCPGSLHRGLGFERNN